MGRRYCILDRTIHPHIAISSPKYLKLLPGFILKADGILDFSHLEVKEAWFDYVLLSVHVHGLDM